MIIARLQGRLGNQMFIYATAYALSRKYNEKMALYKYEYDTELRHNGFSINSLKIENRNFYCGIPISLYSYTTRKILCRKLNKKFNLNLKYKKEYSNKNVETISEKSHAFEPIVLNPDYSKHVIEGYRQSSLYFDEYYDEIVSQFQPGYKINEECLNWQNIIQNDKYSASIHIRRGDYIRAGWTVNIDYYYESMSIIKEKIPNVTFYVFSDDISWAKENLPDSYDIHYVSHESKDFNPFDDIWLMSKCCHNIIANSTYSWWGAYLNCNKEKIVIVPQKIRSSNNVDIVPDTWIVI